MSVERMPFDPSEKTRIIPSSDLKSASRLRKMETDLTEEDRVDIEMRNLQTREWLKTKFNVSIEDIGQSTVKKISKRKSNEMIRFQIEDYLQNRYGMSDHEANSVIEASDLIQELLKNEGRKQKEIELHKELSEVEYIPESIEKDTRDLLNQIKEKIEQKYYDCILGDDASARLHTLLISGIMKELYGKDKKLETVFVKGGLILTHNKNHQENVKKYFARQKSKLGKHVLIVSEEIFRGDSAALLIKLLKEIGIEADIAAYYTGELDDEEKSHEDAIHSYQNITSQGAHLYVVHEGRPYLLSQKLTGVSNAREATEEGTALINNAGHLQPAVNAARIKIKQMAHKIAEDFRS